MTSTVVAGRSGPQLNQRSAYSRAGSDTSPSGRAGADPAFRYDLAVVGLGYVGLPTALGFHEAGRGVVGIDISKSRLEDIRLGDVDLLDEDHQRLRRALDDERFHLTDDLAVLSEAAAVLVCVPTPIDDHLLPDLRALEGACRSVVEWAVPRQTLLLTSTTYVGCTNDLLVVPLRSRDLILGQDIFVAFAPERIDPGNSRFAQREVPRVVGGVTRECSDRAVAALSAGSTSLHVVSSPEAAELTKLYENTFRAVNITLANEFADISAGLGLNITEVIDAAATKPYGFMPFRPGPGVGGHCIPCDPHYLLWQLRARRETAPLVEAAMAGVARRPRQVVDRAAGLLARSGHALRGARILMVGVTYKPAVADVRESPALEIMERLLRAGAEVDFADDRVAAIEVGGTHRTRVVNPASRPWDLILVHTIHPETDLEWLTGQAVLDTTYQLVGRPGVEPL